MPQKQQRQHLAPITAALLLTLACPGAAEAQATGATRQLHVTTEPPGVRAATSHNPVAVRTPHSFQIPAGAHSALTLDGAGLERANVPIPPGAQDLLLNVRMSRPVFEWGIALTVIGGALTIAGVAIVADYYAEVNSPDTFWEDDSHWMLCERTDDSGGYGCHNQEPTYEFGFPIMGGGLGILTAGVLMMVLDRQRDPTWSWGGATPR